MLKSHTYKKIIFPEDNSRIIEGLLDNLGFAEKMTEVHEKIKKGQKGFRMIVADLVKQSAEEKWPLEKLAAQLNLDLGLDIEKSITLANDLQTKIIARAQEMEVEEEEAPANEEMTNEEVLATITTPTTKPDKAKPRPGSDPYREAPLE